MITRRDFIKSSLMATIYAYGGAKLPLFARNNYEIISPEIFDEIISQTSQYAHIPLRELMLEIARLFEGTPYVANTLEGVGGETCRISFKGLDCVTFYELVLCIARIIKKDKFEITDLVEEIIFVRYRGGLIDGYESRLHYTSDWIYDNVRKNVVTDVTKSLGGIEFELNVYFMSSNSDKYSALSNNKFLIDIIKQQEKEINQRKHYYIPNKNVRNIESKLRNSDIIGIVTDIKGLDYSHTGLIYKSEDDTALFFHASTTKKKVIIDSRISEYLQNNKRSIGITVVRPKEIR